MVIAEFAGEFDVAQSERLSDALAVVADADEVILDFSNVSYMDSTMLNALIALRRRRAENGHHEHIAIEGASEMARRLFTITHLDKMFDLRPPAASRPKQAMKLLILGRDLPKSRTAEDFTHALDCVLCSYPEVQARRDSDDVLRWICSGRQCQAHCVSDTEVVIMQLSRHASDPIGYWSVEDVRKLSIEDISPWTAAERLVEYLTGSSTKALQ